jgi:hypothetical protein
MHEGVKKLCRNRQQIIGVSNECQNGISNLDGSLLMPIIIVIRQFSRRIPKLA